MMPLFREKERRELFRQTFNFHLRMVNYREREEKGAEKGVSFPQWFLHSTCLRLGK